MPVVIAQINATPPLSGNAGILRCQMELIALIALIVIAVTSMQFYYNFQQSKVQLAVSN